MIMSMIIACIHARTVTARSLKGLKYKTIVIDPPWDMTKKITYKTNGKFDKHPYDTITDEEIQNFPINNYTDTDCSLFMWSTQKKLPVALKIIETWNFSYSRLITWHKDNGITIHGITNNTELLIFAFKGKMIHDVTGKSIKTVYYSKRTGHSEKPNIIYEEIKRKFPSPRIDIFARKRHDGFDAWGNQVEEEIQTTLKQEVLV